jgi:hypothetical protein
MEREQHAFDSWCRQKPEPAIGVSATDVGGEAGGTLHNMAVARPGVAAAGAASGGRAILKALVDIAGHREEKPFALVLELARKIFQVKVSTEANTGLEVLASASQISRRKFSAGMRQVVDSQQVRCDSHTHAVFARCTLPPIAVGTSRRLKRRGDVWSTHKVPASYPLGNSNLFCFPKCRCTTDPLR